MATTLTPILSDIWDKDRSWTLEAYREHAHGYQALEKALGLTPDVLVQTVKDSGLRGRGGAGFPTGMKWGFLPKPDGGPRYLVVNADESEPGTCKDVPLMFANPHSLIEGVAITSYAIGCHHAFIYVRGEVVHVYRRLLKAVADAYAAGHLGKNIHGSGFDLDVTVHAGAGAYICGEETALLDSLEGRRGQPRLKPPFPAVAGLYARPTVVNNVESIASVPEIVRNGPSWFADMGTERSTGFGFFSLSGHVTRPGQYEAPLGITLRELLDMAGGVRDGHELKFWTPGGSSTPIFTAEHLDVPLDFEAVGAAGSMLGTRALQIFDETTSVVRAVLRWTEFYAHESCGKCTPCREGTFWMKQVLRRIEAGKGTAEDIDTLLDTCDNILGPLVLRARRRRHQPGLQRDQVLPVRVRGRHDHARVGALPVRAVHRVRGGAGLMTATTERGSATEAPQLVTATIDGVSVSVPKGTLVIRAAEQVGVHVPRFCDHPLLDPVGACRQCLVDIATPGPDGTLRPMPKPQPSCAIELTEGMEVKTQATSPVAEKAQHGVMEFLLINHPLDCPVCDKGGECPLQNQAMSDGRARSRFVDVKRTFPKPIKISSQVLLDRERCVLCQRCTRFSKEIAGDPFIDLQHRGIQQQIGTFSPGVLGIATQGEQMLDESGVPFASYFSGNTIQICPVGALTSAAYRFRSRPFDLVSTPSVCEHCASGCAQRTDHRRGTVLRRLAGDDPAVNEEWNCDKGRFAFTWSSGTDRLTTPMVRGEDGELEAVSWPVALEAAARGLQAAREGTDRHPGRHEPARHRRRGPARRAPDPRGRLRLREVRAGRPRHQRRRPPLPGALRGGGPVPRAPRGGPLAGLARRRDLPRPREGAGRAAGGVRGRGGVADRLPAAAQGGPQEPHRGPRDRPVRHPRPHQAARHAAARGPRHRGRGARRRRRW